MSRIARSDDDVERFGCRAFVTDKRFRENYLHPRAIFEASGIQTEFGGSDDVAEVVVQRRFLIPGSDRDWLSISARARRRLRNQAKQWLNRAAAARMTPELLAEQDSDGEVWRWLAAIAELVRGLT
ncbi:MAG TPA: hypothetical protein VHX65_07455 [Pirellulales bacterium]|jgi:hypothetical protein|nr:hypothetical protein [Pirellulales bacterium]